MLVTFKSKAAAEVMMYEEHAKRILDLLNKDVKRGIITAEEMPDAIAAVEAEIAATRSHPPSEEVTRDVLAHHGHPHHAGDSDDDDDQPVQFVSFATRAYPLLEMMRAAQHNRQGILWGV